MIIQKIGCETLNEINFSNLITNKIKDMSYIFLEYKSLTKLNLPQFNNMELISINNMFSGCAFLYQLDLSNFNTYNIQNKNCLFDR